MPTHPNQQRIVDAGYEIAGQVQQELTKEQLSARMREQFGTTERRWPGPSHSL